MPNATIQQLADLGYRTGVAHGSVEAEQHALDNAVTAASPDTVGVEAATIATDTLQQLQAAGKITPEMNAVEIGQTLVAQAAEHIQAARDVDVAFHQRALAIAQDSPDVWHVEQVGTDGGTIVSIYVQAGEDGAGWDDANQQMLDGLADPDAYAERGWLHDHPDATAAAQQLQTAGHTVDRPTAGADAWTVDGGATIDSATLEQQAAALDN